MDEPELDFLHNAMQGSVLDSLRELVTETEKAEDDLQIEEDEDASLENLEKEVEKLQKQKEELMQKLKEAKVKTVKEVMLDSMENKVIAHKTKSLTDEMVDKVPLVVRKRKLALLQVTQAICGFSCFPHGEELVIRLETCFQGVYYEHYQIYLALDKSEKLKIPHHTIPYFIPLETIKAKYLNSDIKTFIHIISEYLNCYVSRRQQLMQLSDGVKVKLRRLQTSNASDYTIIEVEHEDNKYFLQIYYEDMLVTYPTRVDIVTLDETRRKKKITKFDSFFLENRLLQAMELAFPYVSPPSTP